MFGVIFGTLCLLALLATLRRSRYRHMMLAHHGWGEHGMHRGFVRRYGPRAGLRMFFHRLDTTPGQEKAIVSAVETLQQTMQGSRESVQQARKELGASFETAAFDRSRIDAAFGHVSGVTEAARGALVHALADVHEALDDKQRKTLAELIAQNGRGGLLGRGHC